MIEERLLAKAQQLGINIEHRTVNPEEIENLDASVVICADGAHSRCRQHLVDNKAELPLQQIVQMSYKVEGKSKPLSLYRKYPAMKTAGYLVEESAQYNQATNRTTISVRFFVHEGDYNLLTSDENNRPNFRNPLQNLESDLLTNQLRDAMYLWLNYRQERGESPAESIKITPIGLSMYQSPKFSFDLKNNRKAALVGDAASGVPFFRSFNKGVGESCVAAKTIVKSTDYPMEKEYYFKRYERKMRSIANRETLSALSKNIGLNLVGLITIISGMVPWQTNKIKDNRAAHLKKTSPRLLVG